LWFLAELCAIAEAGSGHKAHQAGVLRHVLAATTARSSVLRKLTMGEGDSCRKSAAFGTILASVKVSGHGFPPASGVARFASVKVLSPTAGHPAEFHALCIPFARHAALSPFHEH
jgi:hypothetical protein